MKEILEPTKQQLIMRTSQEAVFSKKTGFSKTTGLGQFFRTRPRCNVEGKWIDDERPFRKFKTYSSQRLKVSCAQIKVSSPSQVASTAWIRTSRWVTQWAHQLSEFEAEFEGTDTVFVNGGTAVAQTQQEDPELCFGSQTVPPPPPGRAPSRQAVQWATTCFLVIKERERQFGFTWFF